MRHSIASVCKAGKSLLNHARAVSAMAFIVVTMVIVCTESCQKDGLVCIGAAGWGVQFRFPFMTAASVFRYTMTACLFQMSAAA
jgi:hypothetical protein